MNFSIVIPTIGKDNMINNLVDQIIRINDANLKKIIILDNGAPSHVFESLAKSSIVEIIDCLSLGIYAMWNIGIKKCLIENPDQFICVFNDDIIIDEKQNWFSDLFIPFLDQDVWATCANYSDFVSENLYIEVSGTFKDGGFGGFCFALTPNAYRNGLDFFDENYNWWYGDDDFVQSIQSMHKKVTLSTGARIQHINGGSQSVVQYTNLFNEKVEKDKVYYLGKWHAAI
jgi:glycosyltransferase involved in cell wall biosynthesis